MSGDDKDIKIPPELNDGKPMIVMSFSRVFCALHGEPFRPTWPKGAIIMQLRLFEQTFGVKASKDMHDKLFAEARKLCKLDDDAKIDIEHMHAVMDKKPLCCRVTPGQLEKLYEESGVGTRAKCVHCHRKRLGTPYTTSNLPEPLSHLCFNCLCTQVRATPFTN